MRRLVLSLLVLASAVPALAQAKHPFTFEDMMKLKRGGDPQVSPDGKWVIFSVVDVNLEANTKTPHIWIVPTAGGQEKEIIADQDADRPRWAPDGKRFAFLSTKEGGSQVWIAQFDGAAGTVTQTHKLTAIVTEAGGELWSPDGKNILFTSDVYPECDGQPNELACNAQKVEEADKSKVKALIFTGLLYRHWNAYKEGKRSHIFVTSAPPSVGAGVASASPMVMQGARDLTPGDYDAPVFSLGGQDDYAFSPDGQEICYASNHDKNPAASTNNDLWIVPVTGAPAKNITADNPASDTSPLYSPDGRYIAYRAQQRPGYESDRFRLMLYDRKTGEKKNLTERLRPMGGYVHVGTGFNFESSSSLKIRATRQYSPSASELIQAEPNWPFEIVHGFNDDLALVNDDPTVLFTRMGLGGPTESTLQYPDKAKLCRATTGSVQRRSPSWYEEPKCSAIRWSFCFTHLNDAVLSQVAMSPLESFWFHGAHSDKVARLPREAAELRFVQEISREVPHPWRAAGRMGGRLVVSLESRTVRVANFFATLGLRRRHDQLPRLDRIRAEVHRRHQRRLGRRSVRRPDEGPRLRRADLPVYR